MTRVNPARVALAGLAYFAAVFAVGFALGVVRVLVLVPRIGTRWAELAELPLMIVASVFVARWLCARMQVPASAGARIAMGAFALALLLLMEFGVVLRLRGIGIGDDLAQRDPVAGTAYLLSLVAFALAPWWVGRRARGA
jgi:hypothetical protein